MTETQKPTETCRTCRFCVETKRETRMYNKVRVECRKNSPTMFPDEHPLECGWPTVELHDWCGEYKSLPFDPAITIKNIAAVKK